MSALYRILFILIVAALCCSVVYPQQAGESNLEKKVTTCHTGRLNEVPDVMQTDMDGTFPDGGRYYCAAIAAADYLVWLSCRGYDRLAETGVNEKGKVLALASILGGEDYMNIGPPGVSASLFLKSVSGYIENKGYKIKRSAYYSFDKYTSTAPPSLTDIEQGLNNNGMVWLLLGRYAYDPGNDIYSLGALHYVSLIGFKHQIKSKGREDCFLIVNCPSPRSGPGYLNENLELNAMRSGIMHITLPGNISIKEETRGYYEIKSGLKWKRPADRIIINGIVFITPACPG